MSEILKYAGLNAFGTALYIVLIGIFMNVLSGSNFENSGTIVGPIAMLMLLVFSVALVGSLIFGRSIVWYIDGKKREAVTLLLATLGVFFAITIITLLLLLLLVDL